MIFCEESGDKQIPWKAGSSDYYIVTSVLIKDEHEKEMADLINKYKYSVLRLSKPLEWKKLRAKQKKNDVLIGRFLKKLDEEAPNFLVSSVICNKHETTGLGFSDRNTFMNYLYGLMFKRICWFLNSTRSSAKLIIDRNTDKMAQSSLHQYISIISKIQTGQHPRHSKPKWINPEEHPVLGLSDFISGVLLRVLENYLAESHNTCKPCPIKKANCIYLCELTNFGYKRSLKYVVNWNYDNSIENWNWQGLIYHPYEYKNEYRNIFQPR